MTITLTTSKHEVGFITLWKDRRKSGVFFHRYQKPLALRELSLRLLGAGFALWHTVKRI